MIDSYSRSTQAHGATTFCHIRRDGHRIAFVVAGAPDGVPLVVLHGGPGSGSRTSQLRGFDLARFHVVLIDQRGAGASLPSGSVRHNSTARLVGDMEAVRARLGIERWGVVGGSWGAALALAYAGAHAERVLGVVVRGLFLTSRREVRRLFVGSRKRAPQEWQALAQAAACDGGRASTLFARCAQALSPRSATPRSRAVALAWHAYEDAVLASVHSRRKPQPARIPHVATGRLVMKYRIQAHYLSHDCWLGERRLLALARHAASAGVPLAAVHGMRDPVCPIENARRLVRAVPAARLDRIDAGHLGNEPRIATALAQAIETMFGWTPSSNT
ncbi:alpha/beta hydrolase [Trinickia sp. LjRoot230]|uniref:alpha/beta fold hydrolase n=1 Tax=Trinickia sp. LjRoot230 TaxID=3342288 RepID=UPI003ED0C8FF